MWTSKITTVEADEVESIAKVTFEYNHTDGRKETKVERLSEPESYKKIALNHIRELNRKDAINQFIATPPIGDIDLLPPTLTEEEIAAQALANLKLQLTQAKENLALGIINQAEYDALLASYKSEQSKK